jgi:ribosomal protein S18 acetylase RimI-like enzyme
MTNEPKRIDMTATLTQRKRVEIEGERRPLPSDEQELAELMMSAYHGTVDDEGENVEQALAEIRKTFAGEYGPFMPDCSRVVQRGGQLVSATLVTGWQGRPFIAFAMTAPNWKRRGIARGSMVNTMQDLLECGEALLSLVVTVRNEPACSLYQSLGFVSGR